jgi:DNA-binding CsgD family transcriptional regulator
MLKRSPLDIHCSDLEVRILAGLMDGYQTKEIAAMLGRRSPTIEGHIRILFAKFNSRSRAQLVATALRAGFLEDVHGRSADLASAERLLSA